VQISKIDHQDARANKQSIFEFILSAITLRLELIAVHVMPTVTG
jgi:hypothetical protein